MELENTDFGYELQHTYNIHSRFKYCVLWRALGYRKQVVNKSAVS